MRIPNPSADAVVAGCLSAASETDTVSRSACPVTLETVLTVCFLADAVSVTRKAYFWRWAGDAGTPIVIVRYFVRHTVGTHRAGGCILARGAGVTRSGAIG